MRAVKRLSQECSVTVPKRYCLRKISSPVCKHEDGLSGGGVLFFVFPLRSSITDFKLQSLFLMYDSATYSGLGKINSHTHFELIYS